ncbi:hypothetical protein KIN20_021311 [Parelaphostrongylus tenuis]|uniref:Uncharacterized protein n=1 Tax=Parelaphostrongylus tenuis TaxID=148309 RepID=A0AAD5N490_PARTN|nr:hypothetical protein KIN20_021311 [Parelaphostrongylus tenuis]
MLSDMQNFEARERTEPASHPFRECVLTTALSELLFFFLRQKVKLAKIKGYCLTDESVKAEKRVSGSISCSIIDHMHGSKMFIRHNEKLKSVFAERVIAEENIR